MKFALVLLSAGCVAEEGHHYEAPPCQDDEIAGQLQGGGTLCAPKCNDDGSCSQDFPEDAENPKARCMLQDQSGGKYCAMTCGALGGGCSADATCKSPGVCVYDAEAKNEEAVPMTAVVEEGHHYEAPPCQDDEIAGQLQGGGSLCAPKCNDDGSCSQDFPEDAENPKARCMLQDQSGGKYCAMTCGVLGGGCSADATCKSPGVCAYDAEATNEEAVPMTAVVEEGHHYEAPPCQDDEIAGQLQGGGTLCAPKCNDDGSCSQDFPEDAENPKARCMLQDQSGGKYCAMTCGVLGGGCSADATCKSPGVCVYDAESNVQTVAMSAVFESQSVIV